MEKNEDLLAEMQFSTLLLPVDIDNKTLPFPVLKAEEKKYVPLFTDVNEYGKMEFKENFTLIPNEFNIS